MQQMANLEILGVRVQRGQAPSVKFIFDKKRPPLPA